MKIALRVAANRILTESDETEENLIYRSLLDVIVPEINPIDLPLLISIIDDLFLKPKTNNNTYEWLREIYVKKCNERRFEPVECQFKKLIEAYEMSAYRRGIMFIGNPYTGKSFVVKTLIDAIGAKNQLGDCDMDLGELLVLSFIISFE